jgi:uncharacterized Zn finger protein
MAIATQILAKVDGKRLQKAVEGMVSGAYEVKVTRHSEGEIRGFVRNGDGKQYGVALGEQGFCSCPDALYHASTCKHQVALALYVIRNPKDQPQEGERKPNLKLARVREGFCG